MIKSDAKPQAAALVTGVDTPEGQALAVALGKAGWRVCGLLSGHLSGAAASAFEASAIPGHDKLKHELLRVESPDAAAFTAAAQRAEQLLGNVTALVHVALPAAPVKEPGNEPERFDSGRFAAQLGLQAGAFLALGLGLLPGMFRTQTGVLALLTARPRQGGAATAGGSALLGAQLGAVRELSERTAGTALRSIALYGDGPGAPPAAALGALVAQLADPSPSTLPSGWFSSLSGPAVRGPIEFLEPPPAPQAPVATAPVAAPTAAAPSAAPSALGKDRVALQLAQTFRAAFGLAPNVDVSNLGVGSVKKWDSLGHLKLMMEVEQALRVRLPADALSRIQSFKDLEKAVRANLPAK